MILKIQIWFLLSCFFIHNLKARNEEIKWANYFLHYLRNKSGTHEAVFIFDNDKQNMPIIINKFLRVISREFPTKELTYGYKFTTTLTKFNSDSSVFIIVTLFERRYYIKEMANFIANLTQNKRRPKLLTIIYNERHFLFSRRKLSFPNFDTNKTFQYHDLLQTMWFDLFLDATVIDLTSTFVKGNLLMRSREELPFLYYYNPYLNLTIRENVSLNSDWFPDKTRDLIGYPMKVGFHYYPPDITMNITKSGEIVALSGLSALKMLTLSEKMNFTLVNSFNYNWGDASCTKGENSGFYLQLLNSEIQVAAVEYPRYSLCDNKFYEFSKGIKLIPISLVVPELSADFSPPSHVWKLLDALAVFGLVVFMWVVSHVLHFDLREWHAIYMVQLVLNTTTPHKPKRIEERIVFASMMWACFFHSSYIYMSFTDFGLEINEESKFQSIDDVLQSGLQTIIHSNYAYMMYNNSEGNIRKLLDEATKSKIIERDCMLKMVTNKNLTCVCREDHAQYIIKNHRSKCGKPLFKVLDETLWIFTSSTVLAPGSPHARRFDTLIQRFVEVGLINKWQKLSDSNSSYPREEIDSTCISSQSKLNHELSILLSVLGFGYILCNTVFFAEILTVKLLTKYKCPLLRKISVIFH